MSTLAIVLWCIAILAWLIVVYITLVAPWIGTKTVSVKANLTLIDRRMTEIGNVEVIGADPALVASAMNAFEAAWVGEGPEPDTKQVSR